MSVYYPDELIEEVRSRNDIVAVIGAYVKLSRQGSNYFGCCPFHSEKTPSFSVSPGKQMYYCFGCGAGGNVLSFLMAYENASFQEAMETLAQRAGITLPRREMTQEDRARESRRERLMAANTWAAKYYYYQLRSEAGREGMDYLTRRGLSEETMRGFGLGYAANTYSGLHDFLKSKDFSDEEMSAAGLVKLSEKGATDRFRGRVMFPILDRNRHVIAFGGRVLGQGEPKYLNSPETLLFDKSRNLYGLHLAKSTRRPYFLLCEGYMDVIALHQAGFDCAVASLGTSLTSGHALLLKRFTQQVILTYDSDGAGVKAAMRAIPLLREAGLDIKVLSMRPYKDPDEFIVHEGAEAYEARIAQAINFFLYESDVWKTEFDLKDPAGQTAFQNRLAQELLIFEDTLERENYLNAVCARHGIDRKALAGRMARLGNRRAEHTNRAEPEAETAEDPSLLGRPREKDEGLKAAQQILLNWAITGKLSAARLEALLRPEDFSVELYREIYRRLLLERRAGRVLLPANLINSYLEDEDNMKTAAAIFSRGLPESASPEEKSRVLTENLRRLRKEAVNRVLREESSPEQLMQAVADRAAIQTLQITPGEV